MRCVIPPSPTAALLTLAMLGAASTGVRAGTPAARLESVADPALEERVSVRLAEITILATLRDKSPVRDLAKEEIRVQSGGQDFQIAYLEALEESYPAGTAPRLKLSLEDREARPWRSQRPRRIAHAISSSSSTSRTTRCSSATAL
ncbi:MAG: hypothetical protein HC882_05920 [Acidobacteria bacterium]|nr:hypothetical protein [Acidobacteriota bacterium]